MLLRNLLRIVHSYKFSIFVIIFFEILYILKGYKGNNFKITTDKKMSDNIPCPYYFLLRIQKVLKKNNFTKFLDLGCGSGRTIDFFSKNFPNKEFIGIEYFFEECESSKNLFKKNKNIEIIQSDFTKIDFFKFNADCFFLNNPFRGEEETFSFLNKIVNSLQNKKNILFVLVNYNRNTVESVKRIQCIDSYYVSEIKGYSICRLDE